MTFLNRLKHFLLCRLRRPEQDSGPERRFGYFTGLMAEDETLLEVGDRFQDSLHSLAENQQRTEEELVSDLIYKALSHRTVEIETGKDLLHRWETLTPREEQVAVLVCRGFTNQQIAVRLGLSRSTIKVYVRQSLGKLGFHSKHELRTTLNKWNFFP